MIGLCMKYFHENYGGMLQAFATTKLIEMKNIEYELIRYEKKKSLSSRVKSLPRVLNGVLLNDQYEIFQKKLTLKRNAEFAKNDSIRMEAFHQFEKTHFTKLSKAYHGFDELCKGVAKYSAIVSGSDQLWSPAGLPTNYYNLMFVPDYIRKISYASSFGVKNIPWYQKNRTKDYLDRIEFISMRENRGSEIVKELTGREVPVVLDPVFMFDQNGWEKLIPVQLDFDEPYIFAYFLGCNLEHRDVVKILEKRLNCKIITLRHLDQFVKEDERFGDNAPYDVDPARFLNLLRGAAFICTDSFHGAAFSIIHRKQFIVFNRYDEKLRHSKNSRIDTLCDNLGLWERRYTGGTDLYKIITSSIDYINVNHKLEVLKKDSEDYIDRAFDGIK